MDLRSIDRAGNPGIDRSCRVLGRAIDRSTVSLHMYSAGLHTNPTYVICDQCMFVCVICDQFMFGCVQYVINACIDVYNL